MGLAPDPRWSSMDAQTFWQIVDLIVPAITVDLVVGKTASLHVAGLGVMATGQTHDELIEGLMSTIEEQVDESAAELMKVTLYKCGECEGVSSDNAWRSAWWSERSRRILEARRDPEHDYHEAPPSSDYGLGDRMVCPRCKYVHADDDNSYVEELVGRAELAA